MLTGTINRPWINRNSFLFGFVANAHCALLCRTCALSFSVCARAFFFCFQLFSIVVKQKLQWHTKLSLTISIAGQQQSIELLCCDRIFATAFCVACRSLRKKETILNNINSYEVYGDNNNKTIAKTIENAKLLRCAVRPEPSLLMFSILFL